MPFMASHAFCRCNQRSDVCLRAGQAQDWPPRGAATGYSVEEPALEARHRQHPGLPTSSSPRVRHASERFDAGCGVAPCTALHSPLTHRAREAGPVCRGVPERGQLRDRGGARATGTPHEAQTGVVDRRTRARAFWRGRGRGARVSQGGGVLAQVAELDAAGLGDEDEREASFSARLVTKIVDNIQLNISRIHVRCAWPVAPGTCPIRLRVARGAPSRPEPCPSWHLSQRSPR